MSIYELSLPCTDELESDNFDPVDYINTCLLPDQNQIIGIEGLIDQAECDIDNLSGEIIARLCDQSERADEGIVALNNSKLFLNELNQQVKFMQEKSEETEKVVKTLTLDIQVLNNAKKNLTKSIITLNHLDILVKQIDVLKILIKEPDFLKLLSPLQMINDILTNFIKCNEIELVKQIAEEFKDLESKLSRKIFRFFQRNFDGDGRKLSVQDLAEACEVVSILNTNIKEDIINWFIDIQLEEYRHLFESNVGDAWLDNLEKRFNWITQSLRHYDQNLRKIFPQDWNVPELLSLEFCEITKNSLKEVMHLRQRDITLSILFSSVSKTKRFEAKLSQYFENDKVDFENLIGCCFKEYFKIYVKSVDKNLTELIEHFTRTNKPPQPPEKNEPRTFIFLSSVDLFIFYKKTLDQCQLLDTSATFLQIVNLFKKYIVEYAEKVLEPLIPKKPVNSLSLWFSGDFHSFSNASQTILNKVLRDEDLNRFNKKEIFVLCCALATSEYCLGTIEKLIEKVSLISTIRMDKTFFQEEKNKYYQINSKCIQLLVLDMMKGCQPFLSAMQKMQWDKIRDVVGQSSYVSSINRVLSTSVPWIRENLSTSEKYFLQFCSKFVSTFIDAFLESILKCKTIAIQEENAKTFGCEQLLLDIHSLKNTLIMLPKTGVYGSEGTESKVITPFTKLVVNIVARAETYVKIAMTPPIPVKDFNVRILHLLADIKLEEYVKLLTMKNIRKKDQTLYIENLKICSGCL